MAREGNMDERKSAEFQGLAGKRLVAAAAAALATLAACDNNHNGASVDPRAGHILIADQFNNRVIEIDTSGNIVWHFGNGPTDVTATSVVGVNDAQAVGSMTLIAGTGAPPGTEPACPDATNGCPDNRVLLVDAMGNIQFQYGTFGPGGAGDNQLNTPVQATYTPRNTILISDQANQRIIEVNLQKQIVWQYGTTGTAGSGANQLSNPNSAELLDNGNVLIADESNNRAIEVKQSDKSIVATFTAGGTASGVAFASRLPGGNTLLTDSNNNRIVEVDGSDHVVWSYATNTQTGSNANPLPTRAVRLANGNTLISDQFNHRVIVVDPSKNLVASYGTLNVAGYGTSNASQGLNAPYDAKVIGDFTGLTPPQ
jgi:hypothetical protein